MANEMTKALDLINPEVLADAIGASLEKNIRFAPFAKVDTTLVGRAGDTITRPKYAYVGEADELIEGVPMDTSKLSMTTTSVGVKETGKAIEVTEQAILTNVDGTLTEAQNQIGMSIADKLEIDFLESMGKTKLKLAKAPTESMNVIDAIAMFNDEDVEDYVLFINSADYTALYKEMIKGNTFLSMTQIAELLGLKEIVRTNRVEVGTAYLSKQGAVEIVYKKRPEVKADDDILKRTVVMAGNTFYATHLYNESGVVEIKAGA